MSIYITAEKRSENTSADASQPGAVNAVEKTLCLTITFAALIVRVDGGAKMAHVVSDTLQVIVGRLKFRTISGKSYANGLSN